MGARGRDPYSFGYIVYAFEIYDISLRSISLISLLEIDGQAKSLTRRDLGQPGSSRVGRVKKKKRAIHMDLAT